MRFIFAPMITCLLAAGGLCISAETATDSNTKMVTIGKTIFEDSLIKGFGEGWKIAKGKWENVEGSIKGSELKEDMHGAVSRHDASFTDGVIKFQFKLEGTKGISLSLNATKGHICRVAIKPNGFSVVKDSQDKKAGDKALPLATSAIDIKPGEWHSMVLELQGPNMLATLDGKTTIFGTHPAVEKPKANIGFTISGESASFRDLKVSSGTLSKTWEKTKDSLLKANK
ncbi:MAG: DUF1080 domain-containing protein [Planctomycetes bacterium]|nr:DUF1080 domain-containing protein [Planctomycetota bacterium]